MSTITKTIVKDIYYFSNNQNMLRLILDRPVKFWAARNSNYNALLVCTIQNKYLPIDLKWKLSYFVDDLKRFGLSK